MNKQLLVDLYAHVATAQTMLNWLADNDVNEAKPTLVEEMFEICKEKDPELKKDEVTQVMRALNDMGAGDYVIGRRGKPSRFEWKVNPSELAQIAKGSLSEASPVANFTSKTNRASKKKKVAGPKMASHGFRLREDLTISFDLPEDITSAETERLSRMLAAIPFEQPTVKEVSEEVAERTVQ